MIDPKPKRTILILWGLCVQCATIDVQAAPNAPSSSPDRVTSQVLFERGKSLFVAGNYTEACPLFEESQRLVPGIGVLLHLGACFEKLGKTASAWAAFQEAADRAKAESDSEREKMARSRAEAMRERRAFVIVQLHVAGSESAVTKETAPVELLIHRDGQRLPTAALGMELPVDPGEHVISAEAPNMVRATRQLQVKEGEHRSVELDLLPLPQPTKTKTIDPHELLPQASPPLTSRVTLSFLPPRPQPTTTRQWVTWSAVGLGAAGLLVGGTAGLVATIKMQDARDQCAGHASNDCPSGALRLQEDAKFPANLATVSIAAGLAGFAFAGSYWYLSRPGRTVVTGAIAPGNAHVALATRW